MVTAVLVAMLVQSAAINSQRDIYLTCLENTAGGAKARNMPADGIEAHLRQTCASAEEKFKAGLIAFDLKNKVARKQATSDAEVQINDFVTETVEGYKRAVLARK